MTNEVFEPIPKNEEYRYDKAVLFQMNKPKSQKKGYQLLIAAPSGELVNYRQSMTDCYQ